MSATQATSEVGDLDLGAQIVQIDRAIAETRKLQAEQDKLRAGQGRLHAEGRNFERDRSVAWLLAGSGLTLAIVAITTLVLKVVGLVN